MADVLREREVPTPSRVRQTKPMTRNLFASVAWVCAVVASDACSPFSSTEPPKDPLLQQARVVMYPSRGAPACPDAFVLFFGNDVGLWGAHRELAGALTLRRVAVAGLDIRNVMSQLPAVDSLRPTAWAHAVVPLIQRSRHELGADCAPLIVAGHSLGAELAVWTAAFANPPEGAGVLLLSPGSRSHLRVTLTDLTMGEEPTGPGSFAVADAIQALPMHESVAIVRGSRDKFAAADPLLKKAGGARTRVFSVPFSGHSLRSLTLSYSVVSNAIDWILTKHRAVATRR